MRPLLIALAVFVVVCGAAIGAGYVMYQWAEAAACREATRVTPSPTGAFVATAVLRQCPGNWISGESTKVSVTLRAAETQQEHRVFACAACDPVAVEWDGPALVRVSHAGSGENARGAADQRVLDVAVEVVSRERGWIPHAPALTRRDLATPTPVTSPAGEAERFLATTTLIQAVDGPGGYRLESRVSARAAYQIEMDHEVAERYARVLARQAAPFGVRGATVVMLGDMEEVPPYLARVSTFLPRGMNNVQVELERRGFPGWRKIAWFMYHRAGDRLIAYYLPGELTSDEAINEVVMTDILTGDVVDMHVRGGNFLDEKAQPVDFAEHRTASSSKALRFAAR